MPYNRNQLAAIMLSYRRRGMLLPRATSLDKDTHASIFDSVLNRRQELAQSLKQVPKHVRSKDVLKAVLKKERIKINAAGKLMWRKIAQDERGKSLSKTFDTNPVVSLFSDRSKIPTPPEIAESSALSDLLNIRGRLLQRQLKDKKLLKRYLSSQSKKQRN